ncbi:caspase family protein [Alphaproteobacteria bacterium]|nr:caspase family protein [Alphaproteobacteria bacterium]
MIFSFWNNSAAARYSCDLSPAELVSKPVRSPMPVVKEQYANPPLKLCQGESRFWNNCVGQSDYGEVSYMGTWRSGLPIGWGVLSVDGVDVQGKMDLTAASLPGWGRIFYDDAKAWLEGELNFITDANKRGYGTVRYNDGSKYVGSLINLMPNGMGVFLSGENERLTKARFKDGVAVESYQNPRPLSYSNVIKLSESQICGGATKTTNTSKWSNRLWETNNYFYYYVRVAKERGYRCGVDDLEPLNQVLAFVRSKKRTELATAAAPKPRPRVSLNLDETNQIDPSGSTQSSVSTSAGTDVQQNEIDLLKIQLKQAYDLIAADDMARAKEMKKRLDEFVNGKVSFSSPDDKEIDLALDSNDEDAVQQTIPIDTKLPTITIASAYTKGKQGIVQGRVNDNTGIAEVTVDGTVVSVTNSGDFEYRTFVPSGGLSLKVQATDLAGLTSKMSVALERKPSTATAAIDFERLNPIGKRVTTNKDALALIVGVANYENTPAKAVFADSDAIMFQDFASEKLGIPESRIKTLINDGADERELLLSVKSWLARASKQGKSDVYVFFAGHGLASDNGEKMYLLPYDGSPELLDDTAILRDRLFSDIAGANPRSVTVFLDTCYSGTTRGTDMLIASRPIAIKAMEKSVPDNFTVFTAAAGDQTAKPLEEAKHGMFSYFLMKGMEGEADRNSDNKITAGELHQYVQANVVQQSSNRQTPELQGDASRVLVQFK